jgi:KAT8 regulatory NSL complex subunit 2
MNQINKTKASVGRKKLIDSSERIVSNLSQYVQNEKSKPQSTTKIDEDDEEEISVVSNTDPFFEINASEVNNSGRKILDYPSDDDEGESDSDTPLTLSNTFMHEVDDSDNESIDSEDEDNLLKRAGIFQIEEVVRIKKEKLQRLQSLYMDQFQRLQKALKDKRRVYLQGVKKEKEIYSNIFDQYRDSPKERHLYEKFKAMNHYHQRKHGTEAILYRKFLEKRQLTESLVPVMQQKNQPKCIFSDGVKCLERPLPQNKYCRKHILEDKKQILFKSCGIEKSGIVCQDPIASVFEESACVLHTTLHQLPRTYVKRKYESETDDEGECSMKEVKVEMKEEQKDAQIEIHTNVVDLDEDIKIN